jgi:hypothetical protein
MLQRNSEPRLISLRIKVGKGTQEQNFRQIVNSLAQTTDFLELGAISSSFMSVLKLLVLREVFFIWLLHVVFYQQAIRNCRANVQRVSVI